MKQTAIRIAIIDDHQIVIDGVFSILANNPQFSVVASNSSANELLKILQQTAIDVLITDVMMPEMNGVELAKEVKKLYPHVKILALSMNGDGETVNEMIDTADISGYLLKNTGKEELTTAILKIVSGGVYFSNGILEELSRVDNIRTTNQKVNITAREIDIIRLIEKEYSNKQIAETLFISERTVETHRKNILRKTDTSNALGIIKYAYKHRLI